MGTPITVFKPSKGYIRAAGGSRSSGGFGSGGASGYDTFINAITQIRDDGNNREILLGHGHDKEIVDKMNSAQLATTVADYAADDVERDKIRRVDELTGTATQRFLDNIAGFNQAEMGKKPVEALGDLFAPDRLGRVGRPDIRPRDVTDMTDVTPQAHWGPGYGEPGQPPIDIGLEKKTVPRGPSIPKFDPISKDAISPPPDYTPTSKNILQALARHPASMLEPLDQSGILNKALDFVYTTETNARKARAENPNTQFKDILHPDTNEIVVGLLDKDDPANTKIVTRNGKVVRPAPSRRLVTTNDLAKTPVNDVLKTSMSAITKIDDTLDLYYQVERLFTPEVLETMGAIKQLGLKVYDRSGILGAIPKKLRPQFERTLNLIQSANEVFPREKFLLTGQAASAIENDFLRTIFLDPENQGPFNFKTAFERGIGKLERRRRRHGTRVKFIEDARKAGTTVSLTGILTENFNEMQKDRNEALPGATPPSGSGRSQLKKQMNKTKGKVTK